MADPAHLGPSEISQALNAKFTLYGGLTPRLGSQRVHITPLAGPVQGIFIWEQSPTAIVQLCAVAGGTFYTAPMTGPPPYVFTAQGSIVGNAPVAQMAAFTDATPANVVYIANGLALYKWNGTSLASVSGPPITGSICVANQRLIGVANSGPDGTNAQLFSWSSLNVGDDLGVATIPGAGGSAVIVPLAQSYLTGVMAFQGGALIGQRNGLASFQGWSQNDISVQSGTSGVSPDTGSPSPVGMCAVENFAIILSDRGVYVVTPIGFLQQISKPIENYYNANMFQGPFSSATAFCLHDRIAHQVYVLLTGPYTFGGQTGNNPGLLVYNYRTEGWSGPWVYQWGGATPQCGVVGQNFFNTGPYVLIGGSDGYVRRIEAPGIGLDDVLATGTGGTPYQMQATCRPLWARDQAGNPMYDTEVGWRFVEVQAELQNPRSAQILATTYPAEGTSVSPGPLYLSYDNAVDTTPRTYRVQAGGRGQAMICTIVDTPSNNAAGQNVYSAVTARGFSYGPRLP